MKLDADTIQSLAFLAADGATVLFPAAALPIAVLKRLVEALEDETGAEVPAASAAQLQAIAAGMAAARASAVTSFKSRNKNKETP